jgi:hypothetical protein
MIISYFYTFPGGQTLNSDPIIRRHGNSVSGDNSLQGYWKPEIDAPVLSIEKVVQTIYLSVIAIPQDDG